MVRSIFHVNRVYKEFEIENSFPFRPQYEIEFLHFHNRLLYHLLSPIKFYKIISKKRKKKKQTKRRKNKIKKQKGSNALQTLVFVRTFLQRSICIYSAVRISADTIIHTICTNTKHTPDVVDVAPKINEQI